MTSGKKERSVAELYGDDPERAEALLFGRRAKVGRRGFLGGAGLAAMGAAVGGSIPFAANMPAGLVPAALAQDKGAGAKPAEPAAPAKLDFPGKDPGLVVLGDKPLNAETPATALDQEITPVDSFFMRNHGTLPDAPSDPDKWVLSIGGEVNKPMQITLGELKSRFPVQSARMLLECAGNGRSSFVPPARGNQWSTGAVGCADWKGVRLADVLKAAELKPSAVYTANYGTDQHLSGDTSKPTLSRGVPIGKAMDENTLIVWEMNGKPLIGAHGAPLRLVVPGWVGSCSHKWLNRIDIRDKIHDGPGMTGFSYRVPLKPIIPGSKGDDADTRILDAMPVRSLITSPGNGGKLAAGTREVAVRGWAWSSDKGIREVEVSRDFGLTWTKATLGTPKSKYDWVRWNASLPVPSDGYYELWARATDGAGATQPFIAGNWNPQGYGANAYHRIAVLIG